MKIWASVNLSCFIMFFAWIKDSLSDVRQMVIFSIFCAALVVTERWACERRFKTNKQAGNEKEI